MAGANTSSEEMSSLDGSQFEWIVVTWHWWIICQTFLIFLGFIGNTCIIYIYTFKFPEISSMNRLIRGLAVADLCTSICLAPIPLARRVPDSFIGHFYCKVIFSGNFQWISIIASVYTLSVMSVDRCLAITYPLRHRLMFSKWRIRMILLSIWLASFLTNSFLFVITYRDDELRACTWNFGGPTLQACVGVFIFSFEYFIPMAVMVSTHLVALRSLRGQTATLLRAGAESVKGTQRDMMMLRVNQRLLRMLFIVVLTFIICWTPDQVSFLLLNIGVLNVVYLGSNIWRTFVLLAFVNSCVNPFIYTASNPRFRRALETFFSKRETIHDSELNMDSSLGRSTVSTVSQSTKI